MIREITQHLRVNEHSREWCLLPYPNHPYGCPNYGMRVVCLPDAPMIQEFVDIQRSLWLVVVEFNIGKQERRMLQQHPEWSRRQARNLLYWQGEVNSTLSIRTEVFVQEHPGTVYTLCPEAMGVNVIATAQRVGVPVKVKPNSTIYKMALVGYPKGSE